MALPNWPGAAYVYSRAENLIETWNEMAYAAQRKAWKRKTGFSFTVPAESEVVIRAMDRGDEETLKAITSHPEPWRVAISLTYKES